MPKRKPSLGKVTISSPFETFVTWFRDEVRNMNEWNPTLGKWNGDRQYLFNDGSAIRFVHHGVVVRSDKPILWLRKGLGINMGHGRIEIS